MPELISIMFGIKKTNWDQGVFKVKFYSKQILGCFFCATGFSVEELRIVNTASWPQCSYKSGSNHVVKTYWKTLSSISQHLHHCQKCTIPQMEFDIGIAMRKFNIGIKISSEETLSWVKNCSRDNAG
jgi:hypothetical protein